MCVCVRFGCVWGGGGGVGVCACVRFGVCACVRFGVCVCVCVCVLRERGGEGAGVKM